MKPRKGKAVAKKVNGKKVSYGQAGKTPQPGTAKGDSYCARSARIRGSWKRNPRSKNIVQRRRWSCPYVPGELRITEYKRR